MFELYNKGVSPFEIAKIFGCKPNNISSIVTKKDKYKLVKDKYKLKVSSITKRYKGSYKLTCPLEHEYITDNLTKFSKEHKLDASNLNRCSRGIYLSHKGWRVQQLGEINAYSFE
jgi:hypothetical protein